MKVHNIYHCSQINKLLKQDRDITHEVIPIQVLSIIDVFKKSWPFAASGFLYYIFFQTNILILYWMIGPDAAGIYYAAFMIGVAIYIYCNNMDGQKGNLANTKLFEFMNWGVPVICTDFSLWKKIVVDEVQCGICVNPYDENEISNAIKYLIENPEIAVQMGKNGRKAVLNTYNWETQAKKLVALYKKII
jgi:hypothetical protein